MRSPLRPTNRINRRNGELSAINRRRSNLLRDLEYEKDCERTKRRQLRLKQVRIQANHAAKKVRERVQEEKESAFKKIGEKELEKYLKLKQRELEILEKQYKEGVDDLGMGKEAVREHVESLSAKERQKDVNKEKAEKRGTKALEELRRKKELDDKLKMNKMMLRRSVATTERLRSAELRNKADGNFVKPGKVQVILVQDDAKKVRFASKETMFEVVEDDWTQGNIVRRIDDFRSENAVETAIRTQQTEMELKMEEFYQPSKPLRAKPEVNFYEYRRSPVIIQDISRRSPSSGSSSPFRDIQIQTMTAPREISGTVKVGGPTSAFTEPKTQPSVSSKTDKSGKDFVSKVLESFVDENIDSHQSYLESTKIGSTPSSEDLTREKFLSKVWPGKEKSPEMDQVNRMMGQISVSDKDVALKAYVQKLLDMKRAEIEDLSISDISSLTTSFSASLSTVGSDKSSSRNLNKSVRFQDVEIGKLRRYYQRQVIANLNDSSVTSSNSRSLTNTTGSDKCTSSSSDISAGVKYFAEEREIRVKEQKRILKRQLEEFSAANVRAKNLLNKSSSSGTTATSSSNATAEFLARLRRMEMPSLKPPGDDFFNRKKGGSDKDELNTSTDLLKVKELDNSSIDFASGQLGISAVNLEDDDMDATPSFSSSNDSKGDE